VREVFKRLDYNQSGTLGTDELVRIAEALLPFKATAPQLRYFRCE
jgi:Ca2+-binding EF-hand superfamily protein